MIVVLDNRDSFVFNLARYFHLLGTPTVVLSSHAVGVADLLRLAPQALVISPGPCTPKEAGISVEVIKQLGPVIPVFGVCLGHQSIGQAFGGHIVKARRVMHGKTSPIHHAGQGVFSGLTNPFEATRYHSLVIERDTLPACLEVTAWTATADGTPDEIMGVRHRELAIQGVQFHPESLLTRHGHDLLKNFIMGV